MTLTLFDLTYRIARELDYVREGTATGGTTTTLIDTNGLKEADDRWNDGTVWVLSAGSAAPEGEYSVISDFTLSSNTASLVTTLGAAIASGDRYAIARRRYPLDILEQSVNRALQTLGYIPITDITTITPAAKQTEYTLPIAANMDLRQVWLETNKDDSDDNRWQMQYNWYVQRTATGTADELILPYQWPTGYEVKLVYVAPHPEVYSATSQISDLIPVERILFNAAVSCLRWRRSTLGNEDDTHLNDSIDRFDKLAAKHELERPIHIPKRTGRIVRGWDRSADGYDFTPGKVRL